MRLLITSRSVSSLPFGFVKPGKSLLEALCVSSFHWCMRLMDKFSKSKKFSDWDESLFTRVGHNRFLGDFKTTSLNLHL